MANGLTNTVKCGATTDLQTFLWSAAAAFGMPTKPAPIEEAYEPAADLLDTIKEFEERIALVQNWSPEEAARQAEQDYNKRLKDHQRLDREQTIIKNRYERMKFLVETWEVPSPEHEDFKSYMLKNLQDSLDHDVKPLEAPPAPER